MTNFHNNSSQINEHRIIMFPIPIGELSINELRNPFYLDKLMNTRIWVVENVRTMRRYIASLKAGIDIENLVFFEMNRDATQGALDHFLTTHIKTDNIGVASEAGLPGMADPGAAVALWAHLHHVICEPLVGPGSLVLAQMASGLNGQQFTFHGYAPIKDPEMKSFIADCGKTAAKTGYTQIFIETPYRSDRFLQSILQNCPDSLYLCIAFSLHNADAWIKTQTIANWKKSPPQLGKSPCVFLLGIGGTGLNS